MNEPSAEQWNELYEVAKNIRKISPWESLWDSNLITIMLPGHEEPFYCSVMGKNGECYAIGIYIGYDGFRSYTRLAERGLRGDPSLAIGFEQHCLMCNFGNREELDKKDRDILKSLNLRFRGRNEWIYFRTMRPGYFPWHIDEKEADILIQVLQNFAVACCYLINEQLTVDFENGETLLRFYSPEKKLWLNSISVLPQCEKKEYN